MVHSLLRWPASPFPDRRQLPWPRQVSPHALRRHGGPAPSPPSAHLQLPECSVGGANIPPPSRRDSAMPAPRLRMDGSMKMSGSSSHGLRVRSLETHHSHGDATSWARFLGEKPAARGGRGCCHGPLSSTLTSRESGVCLLLSAGTEGAHRRGHRREFAPGMMHECWASDRMELRLVQGREESVTGTWRRIPWRDRLPDTVPPETAREVSSPASASIPRPPPPPRAAASH